MKKAFPDKLVIALFLPLAFASNAYSKEHSEHAHSEHEHKTEKHDKTEDAHDHERVQHGSHEHGAARLTLAKTDQGLEIMLESPAANLFGFEHKAHDKEEHETVHLAKEKLEAGETLFTMNSEAKCKLANADIESDIVSKHEKDMHGDEHKDDHHDHKKQSDNDHHAHDHDDEHKDKHDKHHEEEHKSKKDDHESYEEDHKGKKDDHESHDHEKEGTHSDVEVAWAFKCENPTALKSVDTKIFSQFPNGFEHLNVEWITNDGAGTLELESDGTIKLSK